MIGMIVEGKRDKEKIEMVWGGDPIHFIVLNGVNFKKKQREEIRRAFNSCEHVYVLTDPDADGEKVAQKIQRAFSYVKHVSLDPMHSRAKTGGRFKFGVEYCSNRYLHAVLCEQLLCN